MYLFNSRLWSIQYTCVTYLIKVGTCFDKTLIKTLYVSFMTLLNVLSPYCIYQSLFLKKIVFY